MTIYYLCQSWSHKNEDHMESLLATHINNLESFILVQVFFIDCLACSEDSSEATLHAGRVPYTNCEHWKSIRIYLPPSTFSFFLSLGVICTLSWQHYITKHFHFNSENIPQTTIMTIYNIYHDSIHYTLYTILYTVYSMCIYSIYIIVMSVRDCRCKTNTSSKKIHYLCNVLYCRCSCILNGVVHVW